MQWFSMPQVWRWCLWLAVCAGAAGCAAPQKKIRSGFEGARVASILVLPPINASAEVQASASVLAQAALPLAEAGYYVMPVTLVGETFRQNGMQVAEDIHEVPVGRLREIFGADAALYVRITDYGTRYLVITSATVVTAQARLVDLRTGRELWAGKASASSEEGGSNSGAGLMGMLVTALVKQVAYSAFDNAHAIAAITTRRLLSPNSGGLPYGPRSAQFQRP